MTGLNHGWDKDESPNHADFVHGGVDEDDFVGTTRHKKKAPTKARTRRRGCPENDGGPHVYVWTSESYSSWCTFYEENFFKENGYFRREYLLCCGCKRYKKSRYTEEMQKRIAKFGWYNVNYGGRT